MQRTIILASFMYTNQEAAKIRPALVVSSEQFNKQDDVVILAITSQQKKGNFDISLDPSDLEKGILKKSSTIRCGKMLTLEKELILNSVGRISKRKFQEVLQAFQKIFQEE